MVTSLVISTIFSSNVASAQTKCVLTGGNQVDPLWHGYDGGENWCNYCYCKEDGDLLCSAIEYCDFWGEFKIDFCEAEYFACVHHDQCTFEDVSYGPMWCRNQPCTDLAACLEDADIDIPLYLTEPCEDAYRTCYKTIGCHYNDGMTELSQCDHPDCETVFQCMTENPWTPPEECKEEYETCQADTSFGARCNYTPGDTLCWENEKCEAIVACMAPFLEDSSESSSESGESSEGFGNGSGFDSEESEDCASPCGTGTYCNYAAGNPQCETCPTDPEDCNDLTNIDALGSCMTDCGLPMGPDEFDYCTSTCEHGTFCDLKKDEPQCQECPTDVEGCDVRAGYNHYAGWYHYASCALACSVTMGFAEDPDVLDMMSTFPEECMEEWQTCMEEEGCKSEAVGALLTGVLDCDHALCRQTLQCFHEHDPLDDSNMIDRSQGPVPGKGPVKGKKEKSNKDDNSSIVVIIVVVVTLAIMAIIGAAGAYAGVFPCCAKKSVKMEQEPARV